MNYGMFVWKIKDCLPVTQLVQVCHTYHISSLCVKVADGLTRYNQVDQSGRYIGNDSYLLGTWIATLEANGIEVHGWHFLYTLPTSPGAQAGVSGERVQKLGIRSLKLDVEDDGGGGWKSSPYRVQSARIYMQQVRGAGVPLAYPLGLCSYRRPDFHPQVPWNQFIMTEDLDHNAQQCYWAGAHNPGEQLLRSVQEYDEIRIIPQQPVGAMYGVAPWYPTPADITEYMVTARDNLELNMVWFWSMDYVVAHNRWDWLEAASAEVAAPTPPPPVGDTMRFVVRQDAVPWVNIRTGPGSSYPDVGNALPGTVLTIGNVAGTDAWGLITEGQFAGNWACIKKSVRFLDPV
jgi:hypothetical protein